MRAFTLSLVLAASVVGGIAAAQDALFDHRDWGAVLKRYVSKDGLVDYRGIAKDDRFARYVASLRTAKPSTLGNDRDRLAFWINAYNAITIDGILKALPDDHAAWRRFKPTDVKIEGQSFWRGYRFTVAGRTGVSLDTIEHEFLRKDGRFKDPRIHVALVCAARGCPPLANVPYRGKTLATQLHARMTEQIRDPKRTTIDAKAKRLVLSKVFEWYAKDFTDRAFKPRAKSIAAFVADYVADGRIANSLREDRWTIAFRPYDWRLNIQPNPPKRK